MTLVLALLLAGAGVLLVARGADALLATARTPVPQLVAFAPWAVLGWVLALALALAGRRWDVAALAAAALAVQLAVQRQVQRQVQRGMQRARPVPAPVPAGGADGVDLTVTTFNALVGRADRAAVLRLAAGADVLVIEELTTALALDLAGPLAVAGYHARELHPGPGGRGTGIWSRHPLTPLGLLPSTRNANPAVRVHAPAGSEVTVTGVHTTAPGPGHVWAWRTDLAMLAKDVRATSGPRIYTGDFNASADHRGFREILAAGLRDAADTGRPFRPRFTWPVWRFGPSVTRIDHVLVTPDVAVRGVRTVRVPGSDHRAVVARLRLPR